MDGGARSPPRIHGGRALALLALVVLLVALVQPVLLALVVLLVALELPVLLELLALLAARLVLAW